MNAARSLKWLEDKVLTCLILILVAPLMAATAIVIKITSPGPVFYVQDRHGLGGKAIRVFKFRSMHHALRPAFAGGSDFTQATSGDPRITPFGRFLRRSSIDELPQFFNVLLGDMSIVGPRPHPIPLNERFLPEIPGLMQRHSVKPGITGLAQISGARGETKTVEDMRRRVEFDMEYIRTWSVWLDLKIIALTVVRGFINSQP
jgi:putative colanic acid biosynthesis UDP-glucose lipid carrier transferase